MNSVSRRTMMRGVGLGLSASLTQTLLGGLLREVRAATPIKRLVLFTNGNGFDVTQWKRAPGPETVFDLPTAMAPLAPFKQDLLFLERFFNPFDRALHGNQWATLSVRPSKGTAANEYRETPGGISLDRFLAKNIGKADPFPSIALGLREAATGNVLCVSADGPDMKFPAIASPVKAFASLFGGNTAMATDPRRTLARRKSLLDFVRGDVARMNAVLPGPEKAKLDQYLTSIGELQGQLEKLSALAASCAQPVTPEAALDRTNLDPKVVRAHNDVAFNALLCGLTRVAHVSILGMEGPHDRYGWLGDTRGHHDQHHDKNFAMITKIDQFVMGEIAHLAGRLKATPEGNGTMLDNTLVMYVNTGGGLHHGGVYMHPVLLVGNLGGTLRTGRYLSYPFNKYCISDVFCAICNLLGVPSESFGEPSVNQGPLPGLMG